MNLTSKSRFKKRYIALALIAADFILMPLFGIGAAAHVKDQFSNLKPAQLGSVRLAQKPGYSLFLVTSNTPFVISAKQAQGDTRVEIQKNGYLFGMDIGAAAQMPGPAHHCTIASAPDETIIYTANQQTIAKRGGTLEQSVIVTITHDTHVKPEFLFKTTGTITDIKSGLECLAGGVDNA